MKNILSHSLHIYQTVFAKVCDENIQYLLGTNMLLNWAFLEWNIFEIILVCFYNLTCSLASGLRCGLRTVVYAYYSTQHAHIYCCYVCSVIVFSMHDFPSVAGGSWPGHLSDAPPPPTSSRHNDWQQENQYKAVVAQTYQPS